MQGNNPVLIHHKASLDSPDNPHPQNSLESIRACLDAKAAVIEIDVSALADSDYLVLHNQTLDEETTGSGPIGEYTPEAARQLRVSDQPSYSIPLLSDVVEVIQGAAYPVTLHVDYKNIHPFPTDEPLVRLIELLEPIKDQVILSSVADWQLRKLSHMAPNLELGFDPLLYLGVQFGDEEERNWPPYQRGAYGLYDDSLIAREAIWPKADYLQDRCETLLNQVPAATTLFIYYKIVLESLEAGFDWVALLHENGKKLATWTVDVPQASDAATTLAKIGVDYITTNTPLALGEILNS